MRILSQCRIWIRAIARLVSTTMPDEHFSLTPKILLRVITAPPETAEKICSSHATLQILATKPFGPQKKAPAKAESREDMKYKREPGSSGSRAPHRYRLVLSDEFHYVSAVLSAELNWMVENQMLTPYAVFTVTEWSVQGIENDTKRCVIAFCQRFKHSLQIPQVHIHPGCLFSRMPWSTDR